MTAVRSDIEQFQFGENFDVVVAIGLLTFFPRRVASVLMERIQYAVRPVGRAVVNVLVEGTTFMDMFDGDSYCLFAPDELEHAFAKWKIDLRRDNEALAPGGTQKRFSTVVARKMSGSEAR